MEKYIIELIDKFHTDEISKLTDKFNQEVNSIKSITLSENEVNNWFDNFIKPLTSLVINKRLTPKPDGADGINFDIPGEKYWLNFIPGNDEVHLWYNGSYINDVGYYKETAIEESEGNLGDIMRTLRKCGDFYRNNITSVKSKNKLTRKMLRKALLQNGFTKDTVYFDSFD